MLQSQSVKPTSPFSYLERREGLVGADRHRASVSPLSPPHLSRTSKEEVVSGEADRLVPRQSVVTAQCIIGATKRVCRAMVECFH